MNKKIVLMGLTIFSFCILQASPVEKLSREEIQEILHQWFGHDKGKVGRPFDLRELYLSDRPGHSRFFEVLVERFTQGFSAEEKAQMLDELLDIEVRRPVGAYLFLLRIRQALIADEIALLNELSGAF